MTMEDIIFLNSLPLSTRAEVVGFIQDHTETEEPFLNRIMEMGLVKGTEIETAYIAPFGGTIAVNCRGSLIAVRLDTAAKIQVKLL